MNRRATGRRAGFGIPRALALGLALLMAGFGASV